MNLSNCRPQFKKCVVTGDKNLSTLNLSVGGEAGPPCSGSRGVQKTNQKRQLAKKKKNLSPRGLVPNH